MPLFLRIGLLFNLRMQLGYFYLFEEMYCDFVWLLNSVFDFWTALISHWRQKAEREKDLRALFLDLGDVTSKRVTVIIKGHRNLLKK